MFRNLLGAAEGAFESRRRVNSTVMLLLTGYEKSSVKIRKSKSAALIASGYLLLTLAVVSPLIWDGYIGHGNGLVLLVAAALTFPLSVILLLLNDLLSDVNAFYMTGWPYLLTLCELGAGALLNAGLIYLVVTFIQGRGKGHEEEIRRGGGQHPAT